MSETESLRAEIEALENKNVQLQQELAECRRLNQQKDEVLTGVAHDLRNPLHTLTMALEVLGEAAPMIPQQNDMMNICLATVERMDRLIEEILEVTRIKNGNLRVECGPLDLSKIVTKVATDFSSKAGVAVRVEAVNASEATLIWADPFLLERVLGNLLSNALKFTDEGSVIVEINRTDKTVTLQIRDTGCGIPEEELEAIFDPYYQLTTKKTRRGIGFGLYLSREFVERMGGTIALESTVDIGTTFTLTFLTSPIM
jgi:signal transduction histidine kinase